MSDSSVTKETAIPETSVAGSAEQAPVEQAPHRSAEQAAPAHPHAVPGSVWIAGIAAMLLAVAWCSVAAWVALVYIRDLELAAGLGYYMSIYMTGKPPEITFNPAVPPATRLIWLAIMWTVGLWAWLAGFLPVAGKKIGRPTLAFGIVLLIAAVATYYERLLDITPGVILGFLAVASILSGLLASAGARIGRRVFLAAGVLSILAPAGIYSVLRIYAYAYNMYNLLFSFQSTSLKLFFYGGLVTCGITLLALGITMSANADGARTGRQMFHAAGILMILTTAATYLGIYALTGWGGFPPLPPSTLAMVCAAQILHGLVYLAFSFAMPKRPVPPVR